VPLKHPPLTYCIAQLDRNDPVHFRKVTWLWWRHNPHCHQDYWNVMLHHSHFIASDFSSLRSICCVEFFSKENVRVSEVYCRHYKKIWAPVWLYAICRKDSTSINSNRSPIKCNNFSVYYTDVYLQHDCHYDTKVKPEAATAVVELLMMGGKTPETCWAVNKRQDNKLKKNCCVWLVIYLNCTMMHGLANLNP